MKKTYDVIIIGSGPGGLAAAIAAKENGADDVLIIERDVELGGILLQCIHNGFGLELFNEDMPGPTYAQYFIDQVRGLGVETLMDTMVLDITPQRRIFAASKRNGFIEIESSSIVLAMGCRERTRPQIRIPGSRPAGVYTAGTAQRWVNVEGYMPGNRVVILGSGDIGMIMARRLTFEGAKVERVLEVMDYLTGLTRNYVQCLQDFNIPLHLNHTVKNIVGNKRVEAVEMAAVDDNRRIIPGSEELIPCDTLLLSVGLIPENELSRQAGVQLDPVTGGPLVDSYFHTNVPGIFAAGNVVHVYDLVDWVTGAGREAGRGAALYAMGKLPAGSQRIAVRAGDNVRYVVPQRIDPQVLEQEPISLQFRVSRPIEAPVWLEAVADGNSITRRSVFYARPGEMLTLPLKPEMADGLHGAKEIFIHVNER